MPPHAAVAAISAPVASWVATRPHTRIAASKEITRLESAAMG